jgi:hypothetical protein
MRVEHASLASDLMHGRVNEHGGGFHGMPSRKRSARRIDHDNVLGLHFTP